MLVYSTVVLIHGATSNTARRLTAAAALFDCASSAIAQRVLLHSVY
jgi:hypothetical protein